ncbi:hypothetical protein BL253_00905 [Pseudofrankia asymbiotica]|uniref:Uncharacterized protein n=1 Tax=Pseudofrankia asymbiotica TaxID=1834516 RepID=A0A1V2IMH8_9ACTN|nr:hypothetical protein BL253_00905 [Pseudofrankia asymbiotica]
MDCDLRLPASVASGLTTAAGILTRLGREPLGPARWADYHRRFVERYGVSTAVPLTDVLDPAAGLGYPAGYPGSVLPVPPESVSERDQRLLALAWRALAAGGRLDLTDALIDEITDGDLFDARFLQAHGEIAGRLQARSLAAVDAGDYVLAITPARAAGTLSARFLTATGDRTMEHVYRQAPAIHAGAVAVQLSCPPRFTRGQNVARLPRFLPEVLAVGEPPIGERRLGPVDLALTATGRGLLLLETATGRIVDPQVHHALALDRQLPLLARFLAHVPRAYAAALTSFSFGPAAVALPHLPEVRYGRIILAPERWRLVTADLPAAGVPAADWNDAVDRWRRRERCPGLVELADGDLTLRLDLSVPAHAAILRDHLAEHGTALLNRAATEDGLAWIGRAHEIVMPVVRAGQPTPNKLGPLLVRRDNADGDRPGALDARWISARVHTHPAAMDDLLATHLPDLRAQLGGADLWMVRYRNPELTDHLRVRVATGGPSRQPASPPSADGARRSPRRAPSERSPSTPTSRRPDGTAPGWPSPRPRPCSAPTRRRPSPCCGTHRQACTATLSRRSPCSTSPKRSSATCTAPPTISPRVPFPARLSNTTSLVPRPGWPGTAPRAPTPCCPANSPRCGRPEPTR